MMNKSSGKYGVAVYIDGRRNPEYDRLRHAARTKEQRLQRLQTSRAWQRKNPKSYREAHWREQGIVNYTWEMFVAQLEKQGYRCVVCHKSIDLKACPDHNHLTGGVRDILCANCNTLIGMANESVLVLEKAIEYLLSHDVPTPEQEEGTPDDEPEDE